MASLLASRSPAAGRLNIGSTNTRDAYTLVEWVDTHA